MAHLFPQPCPDERKGFQRLPSCDTEPNVLLCTIHPRTCRAIHRWHGRVALLHRSYCYVSGFLAFHSALTHARFLRNDRYLYMGGPLLAGVTVVALSSLAPMILPMGLRALAISEGISLYGGLAVFGGFVLFDTQKILKHARLAEAGVMKRDPINESISLELDMINIL